MKRRQKNGHSYVLYRANHIIPIHQNGSVICLTVSNCTHSDKIKVSFLLGTFSLCGSLAKNSKDEFYTMTAHKSICEWKFGKHSGQNETANP